MQSRGVTMNNQQPFLIAVCLTLLRVTNRFYSAQRHAEHCLDRLAVLQLGTYIEGCA